jgi:N-acylneuraminate cytidylyltransferase/CMP-N,N'-diacetyllegionaminic acid synthase
MAQSPNVVAIVPIRSTDPETPHGGMMTLAGRPLLAHTIEAARSSRHVKRILVTTDHAGIAKVAQELGAESPFLRPSELAAPGAPLGAVLQHAMQWLDADSPTRIDLVTLLEITHPVRPQGLIDQVIDVLLSEELDSAFAAREERHEFWTMDESGNLSRVRPHDEMPRQALQPLYKEMGGLVTVLRADVARAGQRLGRRVGLVPVRDLSSLVDLHDAGGRTLAELLLRSG